MPLHGEYVRGTFDLSADQVAAFEAQDGRGETGFNPAGAPIVVLTSVGARSGKLRKSALIRVEHDGTYAVVASLGGAPQNPAWYFNLTANPHVELQDGARKHDYRARQVDGDEYQRWWDRAIEIWPDYVEYQTKTDRKMPIFVLERLSRKVQITRYGGPDVLEVVEATRPEPAAGQVLVEVVVASLNPAEVGIREGAFATIWPADFPQGMGHDFAGVVAAAGPGVTGFAVGDEVVGYAQRGSMADFAVVDAGSVGPKLAGLGFAPAAVVPAAGATAWATVAAVDPAPGETVFVSAASGGVGVLAGQLARLAGARVIGATSAANMPRLEALGIEPVRYGPGLESRLRAMTPDGLDAVIDTFGGGYVELALALGVPAKRINTITDYAAVHRYGVQGRGNGDALSPDIWSELQALIASGRLVVPIEAEYPLEDIARAYLDVATRHGFGKRAVRLRPDPIA
ncbi:nitroreductase/quinone reductase family protein [Actinoplanes sp. Pm04-4]|uniref:Nitroreductase/quinone reductase family protein n=1 Tax=Paractinoplanes pyxinae TaxID=2997416 RepID=A0ABT4BAS5_9ACTN|nr:nitroreductase/quinone reductase family protein [Actinoplanes pyxinae]MCY1143615.1 nitroreductase/quinone reductase family protein [Actinoplanes pyxinae]